MEKQWVRGRESTSLSIEVRGTTVLPLASWTLTEPKLNYLLNRKPIDRLGREGQLTVGWTLVNCLARSLLTDSRLLGVQF